MDVIEQTIRPAAVTERTAPDSMIFYVAAGDVSLQFEGEWAVIYHTGETFFEPRNKAVARLVNISNEKPAKLIAFHLLNPSAGR